MVLQTSPKEGLIDHGFNNGQGSPSSSWLCSDEDGRHGTAMAGRAYVLPYYSTARAPAGGSRCVVKGRERDDGRRPVLLLVAVPHQFSSFDLIAAADLDWGLEWNPGRRWRWESDALQTPVHRTVPVRQAPVPRAVRLPVYGVPPATTCRGRYTLRLEKHVQRCEFFKYKRRLKYCIVQS